MRLSLDGPRALRHRAKLIGKGDQLVVFSHGLGTDQTVWQKVIDELSAQYSALIFDLPGAGPLLPDDFEPENYQSLTAFADDVIALMEEIGATDFIFVGHSVSGMIGALASIEAPQMFKLLILLNASPRYINTSGYTGGFDKAEIDGLLEAMAINYQAWVAGFAPAAVQAEMGPAVEEFSASLLAMRPDVTVRVARTIFQSDYRDLLQIMTRPVVLIHSRRDIAVPPEVGRYLHEHIPNSRLVWIDAVGHLPHLSAPLDVVKTLEDVFAQ